MAAPKLTVTYTDGRTATAVAGPKAQVACERHFSKSITAIGQDGSIETMYFLAWAALHYAGQEPRDFDQFLDVLEDVEDADSAGAEDVSPTQPAS